MKQNHLDKSKKKKKIKFKKTFTDLLALDIVPKKEARIYILY